MISICDIFVVIFGISKSQKLQSPSTFTVWKRAA